MTENDARQMDETPAPDHTHRPLIVTARMAEETQVLFDRLRQQHFPSDRNWLAAHVTLFHALPGQEKPAVERLLAEELAKFDRIPVTVTEVRFTGNGVAFGLFSPVLQALRASLAGRLSPWLTRQDQQGFRPHVTIQNKVSPDVARALHASLSHTFTPWTFAMTGLDLWSYNGGPWEPAARFSLT